MKRIVVLTQHPPFGDAVRAVAPVALFGVMCFSESDDAVACLQTGAVDAVIVETPLASASDRQQLEALMAAAPGIAMIVVATSDNVTSDNEADAYALGAAVVLRKPVRPATLRGVIMRLADTKAVATPAQVVQVAAPAPTLRNAYSPIVTSSDALLDSLAETLHRHGAINRVFILLNDKTGGMSCRFSRSTLNEAVVKTFRFPSSSGIKANFMRRGGVVTTNNADPESLRELLAFGCSAAIPIRAEGKIVGAVMVDEHVTGEPLSQAELREIFEILGTAGEDYMKLLEVEKVRHSHNVMQATLEAIPVPVVAVSPSCELLYANRSASDLFGALTRFQDLPRDLGSLLFSCVNGNEQREPVRRDFADGKQRLVSATLTPTGAFLTVLDAPTSVETAEIPQAASETEETSFTSSTPVTEVAGVPAAA